MKTLLALLICMFCTSSYADNREWTNEEKTWYYSLLATEIIDWGQTRYIATHPSYHENNPLMGSHPSIGRVNAYFASIMPLQYLLFDFNDTYRKELLMLSTGVEVLLIANNKKHGIGINLKWQM